MASMLAPSIYVDESIHCDLGFIVTAFIFASNDLTAAVGDKLRGAGLIPGIGEYKSGAQMVANPHLRDLREELLYIARGGRIAALISSVKSRQTLGQTALKGLCRILKKNGCPESPVHVYTDEGMFQSEVMARRCQSCLDFQPNLIFHFERDSKIVLGLQVADVVAHTLSQIIREKVGEIVKTVEIGNESGYEPAVEVLLGRYLKTILRYSFFHSPVEFHGGEPRDALNTDLLDWGVLASDDLEPKIKSAVESVFGKLWLGCIH